MKDLKTKLIVVFAVMAVLAGNAYSYPQNTQSKTLTGPWELSVQMQHGASNAISFPLLVEDEKKTGKLTGNLPIVGKPIRIQLQEYLPDLQWETNIAHKDNGGIIAKMHITGNGLDRQLLLDSEDEKKKSVKASIGSVTVRKLHDEKLLKKIADQIADPKVLGIISVWLTGSDRPIEFLATEKGTFSVPDTNYRITVEQYMPHYSIDTDTRRIVNKSDKPVNPAVRIKTEIDGETGEQWLWSKFPSYPHSGNELPFRIEYFAFKFEQEGQYLLAGANASQMYLFCIKDGKPVAEKTEIDKQYLFKDKIYSFRFTEIQTEAAIETKWTNKSESLKNPAIIASILQNGHQRQAILELNKPYNYQAGTEPMVFVFRKKQSSEKNEHLGS